MQPKTLNSHAEDCSALIVRTAAGALASQNLQFPPRVVGVRAQACREQRGGGLAEWPAVPWRLYPHCP